MEVPWRFEMFGGLRARRGPVVVTHWGTHRAAALLARLCLFPHQAHPREELIDLLWPDADIDAGRNRLRVALASLRRQLEPPGVPHQGVLLTDRASVRLNPVACRSDVAEFEAALKAAARSAADPQARRDALERALSLMAGELLPGFYDDWILDERERLNALHEDALERHAALLPRSAPPAFAPVFPVNAGKQAPPPQTLPGFPLPFTRFFGREGERDTAVHALAEARLVTLTGPGGVGKTRLAVEVAHRAAPDFPGPVCWVALADLAQPSLIADAVAYALGLTRTPGAEPLAQVVEHLAALPPALLVLDNFEHVAEGGAPLLFSLLSRVPHLSCLVTSRRRLALPGEREQPVSPLMLPDVQETLEQIARNVGVQIFTDRAQAARPDFQITPANAAAVAGLCRTLDGLPLAIELVAARAQTLTPAQMHARLSERFALPARAGHAVSKRHESLWAAMSYSYDLLPSHLQHFFAGLSVFRGGCTTEAAAAVCSEPGAMECLTQLRERSLLVIEDAPSGIRFRLLETLREFAGEQVSEAAGHALRERHAAYFEMLAAQAAAVRYGPEREQALQVLDAEMDNLRAALAFGRDGSPEDAARQMRLTVALSDYWKTRGLLQEGLEWLDGALQRAGVSAEAALRARALSESGWLAAALGHHDRAKSQLTEAIGLARECGEEDTVADALRRRGTVTLWEGNNAQAAVDLESALALSRATGDPFLVALALNNVAMLAERQNDPARSGALYEEALGIFQHCGERQRAAYCLHNLGNIASEHDGDHERGAALLRESLSIADALGDHWHRAYCFRSLGDVAVEQGDLSGAARLLKEGRQLCHRLGDRMSEAGTVCSLGLVARREGNWTQAEAHYKDALSLYQSLDHAEGRAICRVNLAEIAAAQGHWNEAASLLAAAACDPDTLAGNAIQPRHEAARQAALQALGPQAFADAWKCGAT